MGPIQGGDPVRPPHSANTIKTAESHREVRGFARQSELPYFYDLGEGICHQVLPEKGHVRRKC